MELDHHRGGSGEPLVLIHGLGHTWRGYKPMLALLEPGFDVLALDLPGFGRNAPAPAPLLRNPVGRTLFAGPALGKPWRADAADMIEQAEMFAHAPGFLRTLPHTTRSQARGLDSIRCPVLVLWGTRDLILLPRQGRRFERLIAGSELRYLKGLGHTPMSDDPELLARAIENFAKRSGAPA